MDKSMSIRLRARCCECGECLHWYTKAQSEQRKRHPMVKVNGKSMLARRVLFVAERGPLAGDESLTPTCGDEYCIEPMHQRKLTKEERNILGGRAAAFSPTRAAKVSKSRRENGRNKLSQEQAQAIMAQQGEAKPDDLAQAFGVSSSTVRRVWEGRYWRDYTSPFSALGARRA